MKLKAIEAFLRVWPQWATCLTVALMAISIGLSIGWTSPYLARLTLEDSEIPITDEEGSWIVSLLPFGRLFGAIGGSVTMEYYGSKRSLLMSGIPIIIGWICIIFANSAFWLYVFRVSAGISFGMYYSCFAFYMGEIASANIRGALVSTIVNGMPFGTLIGNIMGSHVSMMCFGLVSLVLTICFMTVFPLLPQSPHYYVRQNNAIEAKKTIQWYHRKSNVNVELEIIEDFVQSSKSTNFRDKINQVMERKNRRAFYMIILLFIFMQLSGLNTVTYYMEIIIRSAKVTSLEPATVVIISTGIGIVIGWISVYLIDRCGRKVLIAVSCGCVIIAMVLLGLHFLLLEQNFDPKSLEWLPILAMILFMMMSIGLIPVPSTILSELFPDDLKSIAGFTASITSALFAFICSRTYQPLIDLMSEKYVFWMYAIAMTVCLVYSITEMPETKGKTLQEIQDMLASESKKGGSSSEITRTLLLTFGGLIMTEARSEKLKKKVFWPQWIAGCGVWLLITELGLVGGWSSPYIGYLTSAESTFPVTLSEISWVVSLFNLGRFFGAIGGAICVNYVGSKTTITISTVPISLGWLFIILSNSVEWLYVSRFCSGISLGMTYCCYSIYLGEIADPSIRGALMALGTSGVATGNFIMSVMGAYLSMTVSATIALAFCLLLMILFIWLPESPHHLIKKSLDEKAKSSIRWYHRDYDIESEFMDLRKFVENVSKQTLTDSLRELKILHFRKSIIIVTILTAYAQLSGINNISFYMESIFTSAKVSVMEPAQVVIIVMACGIIGSCLSMLLMDRLGRRILMVISCTGIALSLILLTVEFQLLDFGFDSKTVEGLAITGMIAFYITVFSGVTLLPPTMLGELFPPHLKCIAAFIVSSTAAVVSFISTVTYMPLLNFLNERYLFLFYGLLEATAIPFTLICVPETKGMSLQEIQDQLTGKSKA